MSVIFFRRFLLKPPIQREIHGFQSVQVDIRFLDEIELLENPMNRLIQKEFKSRMIDDLSGKISVRAVDRGRGCHRTLGQDSERR